MTTCVHRYRIEEPNGMTSVGRCRTCGAEKSFLNVFPGDLEERARASLSLRPERRERVPRPHKGGTPRGGLVEGSVADLARAALQLAGRPMKVAEIARIVVAAGRLPADRQRSYISVHSVLSRRSSLFKKTGVGEFALIPLDRKPNIIPGGIP